ncbi:MAG: hypothetical protein M1541_01870 [Acidobacteria bacterium]|nr:hypothetical protein [Acidobacteriota bacterium]
MESLSVNKTSRYLGISRLRSEGFGLPGRRYGMLHHVFMVEFILALLGALRVSFRSRHETAIEIFSLRQQVAVLKRKRPRPKLNTFDRLFWTTLRRVWSRWADVLVIVKPETVSADIKHPQFCRLCRSALPSTWAGTR